MGSSPLTRGKLRCESSWSTAGRLIPAHAGKTAGGFVMGLSRGAHPRSRGENGRPERRVIWKVGSSPLTRGKRIPTQAQRPGHGLIPAHAGKTACDATSTTTARAHPRSRGENCVVPAELIPRAGSSPLTRGKPTFWHAGVLVGGLIPAHAGKTFVGSRSARRSWAHPRSRGENAARSRDPLRPPGSSPLTRGKRSPDS